MTEARKEVVMGLERVLKSPRRLQQLRREPLKSLLESFCDWLLDQGFPCSTVRRHVANVGHLNRWLGERSSRKSNGCLSRSEIDGFFEAYPSRCRTRSLEVHLKLVRHSISRFVEFLREKDLFDPLVASPLYQGLLDRYLAWMREHQHTARSTLEVRRRSVTEFLRSLGADATIDGMSRLTPEYVESFLVDYAREMGHGARRSMQVALRTFLRFCFQQGYSSGRLDYAVPTIHTYKLARVPRSLSEAQAQAVLESVDRSTDVGRRDYAILTLLHAYGVRGGQLRVLQLDDIRWAQDKILFKATKRGKDSLLPLTLPVGESLLDYLQNSRPRSVHRNVFLTSRAPYRPFTNTSTLSGIVSRRIRAAGIEMAPKGTSTFRHALATRMVTDGHPLKAVADILGHRHLSTTFIYTKVDFPALSEVALEWPEEIAS